MIIANSELVDEVDCLSLLNLQALDFQIWHYAYCSSTASTTPSFSEARCILLANTAQYLERASKTRNNLKPSDIPLLSARLYTVAMIQTGLIQSAHDDLVTDLCYDYYGLRLATSSLDQR